MSASAEEQLREAGEFLLARVRLRPAVGVILGSGLADVLADVTAHEEIAFADIPHMASPTVAGHAGRLVLGTYQGRDVALVVGRLHGYEGYSPWQVTFPVRLLWRLGVRTLIVTNAAGALNPDFLPGDLMLITDHVNLPGMSGANPLLGLGDRFGQRFVSMGEAYDADLRRLCLQVAAVSAVPVHEGVYIMVSGPSYETNAELRLLRAVGGDAVGMSTASEVTVAAHLGMRVLGISCITNQASGSGHPLVSHSEVLAKGRESAPLLAKLLLGVVAGLGEQDSR